MIFTTTIHLMAVNLAAFGPLICIWLARSARLTKDAQTNEIGRRVAILSLKAMLAGTATGLLQGGIHWLQEDSWLLGALEDVPPLRIGYLVGEWAFYIICIGAYIALWQRMTQDKPIKRLLHAALAVLAATNLLYHFPTFFVSLSHIASQPEQWAGVTIDAAANRQLFSTPEVFSRIIHHWLAGATIAGVIVIAIVARAVRETSHSPLQRVITKLSWVCLISVILQIPSGIWVLTTSSSQELLMGGDGWATILLTASAMVALYLMHKLAAIALGDRQPSQFRFLLLLTVVMVLLMSATRHRSRKLQMEQSQINTGIDIG